MITKCYICQYMPKYTYFTDKNGCRKVQMFCRNCHNHSLPKNSDPEAVKSWNDNNLLGFEMMKKIFPFIFEKIEQGHFI